MTLPPHRSGWTHALLALATVAGACWALGWLAGAVVGVMR